MVTPNLLSHYELLERIGTGGMGTVWRARDTRNGRIVAVKVLHQHLAADREYVRRFEREARIAQRIESPNVVRVFEFGQEGEQYFLVMEYVAGKTLAQHIHEQGRLSVAETIRIATAITEGLGAAHRVGIVHRDISPQNVILQPDGDVKVTDFGVARDFGATRMTSTGVLLGKPQYIAPEIVMGQSEADIRTDIYALGVVMYQLLTGSVPFDAETAYAVMIKQAHDTPVPLARRRSEIPAWLVAVVDRCMAKQPQDRYQTPAALLVGLRAEGVETGAASTAISVTRGIRRRRNWLVASAGCLGVALFGSTIVLSAGGQGSSQVTSDSLAVASPETPSSATALPDQVQSEAPSPTLSAFDHETAEPTATALSVLATEPPSATEVTPDEPTDEPATPVQPTAASAQPTQEPTEVPISTNTGISENFEAGFNPFPTGNAPGGQFSVVNGALVLRHTNLGYYAHALLGSYENVHVAVDILWSGTGTSDDKGGGVGIACRRPTDFSSTDYRIEVNPATSQFRLIKLKDAVSFSGIGLTTFINWTPLPQPWEVNVPHHLELTCSRDSIEAKLNGRTLGTARDSELTSGQVTLFGQGILEVTFDNVDVTPLQ